MTAEETHETLQADPAQTLDGDAPIEDIIRTMQEGRGIRLGLTMAPEGFAKTLGNAPDGIWAPGPDTVDVSTEYDGGDMELTVDGQPVSLAGPVRLKASCPATLWPSDGGGIALHATRADGADGIFFAATLTCTADEAAELRQAIFARNARYGLVAPPAPSTPLATKPTTADGYLVHTSQEFSAATRAVADGKRGRHWEKNEQAGAIVWSDTKDSHRARLELTEQEISEGITVETLEAMMRGQDADSVIALYYVAQLLAPPAPLAPNTRAAEWIDLDDVASKTWPAPRSTQERRDNRARVWEVLRFVARLRVTGKRTKIYRVKGTEEEIPTQIDGPIWFIGDVEQPRDVSLSLWPSQDVPLRVEVLASRDWTDGMTGPLKQCLPMGEAIGAIPGNKPQGAWARCLGLALAYEFRMKTQKAVADGLHITRRELLQRYEPKTDGYNEILQGAHPGRALTYWQGALKLLVECGLLDSTGEPVRAVADIKAGLPRYDWEAAWLDERVELHPGAGWRPTLEALANATATPKPRELQAPKKRGRPRNKPKQA